MNSTEALSHKIRKEFLEVPFPSHCGLHAAVAKDDWVKDERILREITQRDDYIGKWWDVPKEHLLKCMMALSYLDAAGMEFYLPAYMSAIIESPSDFDEPKVKSSSWQIIHTMLPDEESQELKQYFHDRFSGFLGGKKQVCREFLQYIESCRLYDEHARKIAQEALGHEFWSSNS